MSLLSDEEDEKPSSPRRSMRWKLRSSAISSKNYCEETSSSSSSSEEEDEENEEQEPTDTDEEIKITKTVLKKPQSLSKSKTLKKANGKKNGNAKVTKNARGKRKSSSGGLGKFKSIASYFGGRQSSSSSSPSPQKEQKKRKIDPEIRAFLDSGVPEVVIRTQKIVEKKKEEDEYLSNVGFFPKIQQVSSQDENPGDNITETEQNPSSSGEEKLTLSGTFKLLNQDNSTTTNDLDEEAKVKVKVKRDSQFSSFLSAGDESLFSRSRRKMCCKNLEESFVTVTSNKSITAIDKNKDSSPQAKVDMTPWIDKYKVEKLKDLVCDKVALNKFITWLKQWKSDIKDDGGASRKLEKKKRRRDSDSDFVTSDDGNDEFKKKSVLLAGPCGSGKSAAVYVTAQHYGFHVVEVNFSSRRSGKELLQRVEEAVLSQRVQSSKNCLLLFEDIDLLDPKEDEGFHAAVAQLITTALRPIVMTTGQSVWTPLDSKIEKKDPLLIQFTYQRPSRIIRKILLPIINDYSSTTKVEDEDSDEEQEFTGDGKVKQILDSVCRHGRGDIRQVINQSQFLFSGKSGVSAATVHQHSIQQWNHFDLDFIRGRPGSDEENQDDLDLVESEETAVCLSSEARKRKKLEELDNIAEMLGFLSDLDVVNGLYPMKRNNQFNEDEESDLPNQIKALKESYFDSNLCSFLSKSFSAADSNSSESNVINPVIRKLILQSEDQVEMAEEIYKLSDEVGEYFDRGVDYESASCLRLIVKKNKMDSVGRLAKRNGRLTCYFNRLDKGFVDRICATFGYDKELNMAKEILRISNKF